MATSRERVIVRKGTGLGNWYKNCTQHIKNSSTATSSIHYSGANVLDDKENSVGKDCVPKVNWHWCGGRHWAGSCKFQEVECHSCTKVGHIAKMCKSGYRKPKDTNHFEAPVEKKVHTIHIV